MSSRFTIDGSDALEARLASLCNVVRERVLRIIPARYLHAIVLGGGYGRGEGGVLSTSSGDEPYNDLEFYLIARGSDLLISKLYGSSISHLAEELSDAERIEIELKLLTLRKLQRSGVTMFYYDLVSGHRLVHGADKWLGVCEHHRAAHRIPLHEATRLLMNRCSGLLFAQERFAGSFDATAADFVGRNLAKAKLALGDALLTMRGQYHWSCRERHKRLAKIADAQPDLSGIVLLHGQGLEFKLHPVRTQRSAAELSSELAFLKELSRDLWLQLESRRLAKSFGSIDEYIFDPGTKCPETRPLKNRLVNVRTYGLAGFVDSTYPRERLLRALPNLLWRKQPGSNGITTVADYEALWRVFN